MLRKKTNGSTRRSGRAPIVVNNGSQGIDRRGFLRGSGLAIGGLAAIATTGGSVTQATAQTAATRAVETVKSVCTHCSVGCTVIAEVDNGVWTGQEPGWDSPFNLGAHCAKGAAVREHAHGERARCAVGIEELEVCFDCGGPVAGGPGLKERRDVVLRASLLAHG